MQENNFKDLAPHVLRQRLIIEGTTKTIVKPAQIIEYLKQLADVSGMQIITGPFASSAHELGFAGYVHWRTSGCDFYSYPSREDLGRPALFTVDTYTCKPFSINAVIEFTRRFFDPIEIVFKEVKIN